MVGSGDAGVRGQRGGQLLGRVRSVSIDFLNAGMCLTEGRAITFLFEEKATAGGEADENEEQQPG